MSVRFLLMNQQQYMRELSCEMNGDEKLQKIEDAVSRGDLDALNQLLQDKEILENITFNHNCVLRLAAENGHIKIVDRLLQIPDVMKNANASGLDKNEEIYGTALDLAARNGHLVIVERLVNILSDSALEASVFEAISLAIANGHSAVVNYFLSLSYVQKRIDFLDYDDLEIVIKNGYTEVAKRLLEFPIIQVRHAAATGDLETFKKLFKDEGTFRIEKRPNILFFEIAAKKGQLAIINYLLDEIPEIYCIALILTQAVCGRHLNIVNRLLEISVFLEIATSVFDDALRCGHLPIVDRFMAIPSVVEYLNSLDGITSSLRSVAERGHVDILNRLLEFAELNQIGIDLKTAQNCVEKASSNGHASVLNRLFEIEIFRQAAISRWEQFLDSASQKKCKVVVNCLLQIPQVLALAINSNKALLTAIQCEDLQLTNRLLEMPAVLKHAVAYNNCALDRAAYFGYLQIMNRLLMVKDIKEDFIAQVNLPSRFSWDMNALQSGAQQGHLPIVYRLIHVLNESGVRVPSRMSTTIGKVTVPLTTFNGKIYAAIVDLAKTVFPRNSLAGVIQIMLEYAALPVLPVDDIQKLCALEQPILMFSPSPETAKLPENRSKSSEELKEEAEAIEHADAYTLQGFPGKG